MSINRSYRPVSAVGQTPDGKCRRGVLLIILSVRLEHVDYGRSVATEVSGVDPIAIN